MSQQIRPQGAIKDSQYKRRKEQKNKRFVALTWFYFPFYWYKGILPPVPTIIVSKMFLFFR
jgi:hypothetical protein